MKSMILITLCLLLAGPALALDAAATAECVGSDHIITVTGYYLEEIGGEVVDGEIVGIVFECEAIGVCEPGFFFPETPLPFDPQPSPDGFPVYTAQCTITPPLAGAAYRYTPYGVRPDGSLVATQHNCDADQRSYALASCPGVPLVRGTLVHAGASGSEILFGIQNCEANCWTESVWLNLTGSMVEELSGLPWTALLDQTVDVFGDRTYCTMPGGDYNTLTAITLASDPGCGPVPVQAESWGGLKAMYR